MLGDLAALVHKLNAADSGYGIASASVEKVLVGAYPEDGRPAETRPPGKLPFDAMVCVLDGTAEITIAGVPVTVGTGEMIIMPANKPHSLKAVERFKMMLTMIRA